MKSAEFIGWALGGLEREIAQTKQRLAMLNEQAARLRARVGAGMPRTSPVAAPSFNAGTTGAGGRKRKRRKMSPEARKRISEAQTKRWAERRKAKG
jgi:hypothetical protein